MTEQTRYRVTGSIFLIALAVIFLPMLFDGAGAPVGNIPPPPEQPRQAVARPFDDVVPTTDVLERVAALRDEVDGDGFTTDTMTLFGEPVLQAVTDDTAVWAVQAATFKEVSNARKFRTQLRDAGYEAFISTTKSASDESLLYRVAVGPYLSLSDVDATVAAIDKAFSVKPQPMAMTQ